MMGDETSASSVQDILAAFMPVFLRVHVAGDFIDFQLADLLTFRDAVVVEELAVGEDQRTVLFGGVDSVRQRVDVVSATLYVSDVLDVTFDVAAAVR